jgi:tetrahydromethanopterin S-methyltransferase subunit H
MFNMFQTKDKLVKSRKPPEFDKEAYAARVHELERLSEEFGIPVLVGLVAPTEEEAQVYTEFFLSLSDKLPFGIDTWTLEARLTAARYISKLGLQNRFNYNSITAWDPDIPAQVAELKSLGIRSVILQPFDMEDKRPSGRMKSLEKIMEVVEGAGFESILVDTTVMNLPTHGFCLLANRRVKEEYGLPAGNAPANASYMWTNCLKQWGPDAFRGMDAGMSALSTVLWSDWMQCGPMTGMRRVFAATAAATAILTVMAWEEGGDLPDDPNHPLNKHWPEEVAIIKGMKESKGDRVYRMKKEREKAKAAGAS